MYLLYIWVNFLNRYNFGEYMYDFGGRKTSITPPFIRKELCNQRPFNRALIGEFKTSKKVEKNMLEKKLKIAYFQHFFDNFQHFFNFFFNIFFSTFFAFLRSPRNKQNFIFLVKSHIP